MKPKYKKSALKWSIAVLALTLLVGCSSLNKPSNQNNSANNNQNQTNDNPSSDSNSLADQLVPISVSGSFTNKTTFKVPKGWTEQKVGAGDAGGYAWTNPNDPTQEIEAIESGNVGALMGESVGKWNIKGIFGQPDIQWSNISSNGETGNFTDTSKVIPFSASGSSTKTQYTGYGKAFIITKPEPYSFYVEVWGSQTLANAVLSTVQIASQSSDPEISFISNMMQLAKEGKVINNSTFPAGKSNIEAVEKVWGKPDQEDYVADAKGTYATYLSHNVVFGFNKGEAIFEVRSLAKNQFVATTIVGVEKVLGTPAYHTIANGQEIIGYQAGAEYKIEMVFPLSTTNNPYPPMDHYNVLYPQGTANEMANDPGRQW